MPGGGVSESDTVQELSVLAGVDSVIIGTVEASEGNPPDTERIEILRVSNEELLWSVSSRHTPVGETTPEKATEATITVNVRDGRKLEVGRQYAFFMTKSTLVPGDGFVRGDWYSWLEVDVKTDTLVPNSGEKALDQAEQLVDATGSGLIESLVLLVDEQVAGLSEYWEDGGSLKEHPEAMKPAGFGPLSDSLFGVAEGPAGVPFAEIAWEIRQLPTDDADLDLVQKDLASMGIDLVWWEVAVQYDDLTLKDAAWVGLEFDGIGIIGPVFLEPADRIVPVFGYGPNTEARVVFWPAFDEEHRSSPPSANYDIVDLRVSGPTLSPIGDASVALDGALYVNLNGSYLRGANAIDGDTLDMMIAELNGGPDGFSELGAEDR